MKVARLIAAFGFLPAFATHAVWADYRDDIGYTRLQSELGEAMPTGAGVVVTQVEGSDPYDASPPIYAPDPSFFEFSGKSITFPAGNPAGTYSAHATSVGQLFYGNDSSMAPGVSTVSAYEVNAWLNSLGTFFVSPTTSRIANHSWVGDANTANGNQNPNLLRLVDRLVYQQQYIQVVAMGNNGVNLPLLGSAYNVIAVGLTNATSGTGSVVVDSTYVPGRTRPDLVAPQDFTSGATPIVSSAAALLVQTGHQGGASLSHGTTTVAGVGTVYNAERSETVKAALIAGADRITANTSSPGNITDYRSAGHQTANGLDDRYGAGQVDIYNSYHIIAAGEQESGGSIGTAGFDFNAAFGGLSGSQTTANYNFTAQGDETLSAALVWNLGVSNNSSLTTTFHHLGLSLYDLTDNTLVAQSNSLLDNTQNLWLSLFDSHQYQLRVSSMEAQNFSWAYALAWNIQPVPLPASAWLLGSALAGLGFIRKARPAGRETLQG